MNQIYSSFLLIFDILDSFQYLIFINNVSMNAFENIDQVFIITLVWILVPWFMS